MNQASSPLSHPAAAGLWLQLRAAHLKQEFEHGKRSGHDVLPYWEFRWLTHGTPRLQLYFVTAAASARLVASWPADDDWLAAIGRAGVPSVDVLAQNAIAALLAGATVVVPEHARAAAVEELAYRIEWMRALAATGDVLPGGG